MNQKQTALRAIGTVSLLLPACTRATDLEQEKKNVQQVMGKYLQSVNAADLTLATQVWVQSQDAIIAMLQRRGRERIVSRSIWLPAPPDIIPTCLSSIPLRHATA